MFEIFIFILNWMSKLENSKIQFEGCWWILMWFLNEKKKKRGKKKGDTFTAFSLWFHGSRASDSIIIFTTFFTFQETIPKSLCGSLSSQMECQVMTFFFFFSFPNFLFSQYLVVFGHFWWTIMSCDVKPLGFRCSSIFVSTRLKKLGCLDFTCLIIYWFVWRNHGMGSISSVDTTCLTEIGKLWNFKKISIRNLCPLPLLGQDFFNGSLIKLLFMERMINEVKNSFFFFILSSGFGVNKDY